MERDRNLLEGIDICPDALRTPNVTASPAHRRACVVCRRRWRVARAARGRWTPMEERAARRMLRHMAEQFVSQPDEELPAGAREFYAALAGSPLLESDFACEVAAAELKDVAPPPLPSNLPWQRPRPE
jgi:hypothetical protein